jgi:hypothetical protein
VAPKVASAPRGAGTGRFAGYRVQSLPHSTPFLPNFLNLLGRFKPFYFYLRKQQSVSLFYYSNNLKPITPN